MSRLTEYHANGSTFATIEHDRGSITLLIPEGMSIHDSLRHRAEERKKAAYQALRNADIILSAIDLLDTTSPRRAIK